MTGDAVERLDFAQWECEVAPVVVSAIIDGPELSDREIEALLEFWRGDIPVPDER